MDDLPWIVVHGASVWAGALAGLPTLGALLGLGRALGALVRRLVAARRALGAPLGQGLREDGMPATLAGRLVGSPKRIAATTVFQAGRRLSPLESRAADGLAIRIGDETIPLEGTPRVLVGSVEAASRWRRRVVEVSVRRGDPVLAGGVLRRVAAPSASPDYRRIGAAWTLAIEEPYAGHGLVYAGFPPLGARALRGATLGAAIGLGIFLLVFVAGGFVAARAGAHRLAAAAPLERDGALAAMRVELRAHLHHDERLVEEEAALARLAGRPEVAQDVYFRHRQLRRAADAERFGGSIEARVRAAAALAELGRMEEASLAMEEAHVVWGGPWGHARSTMEKAHHVWGDLDVAIVHLLAGRDRIAARTLRAVILFPSQYTPASAEILPAVADAIDARVSGDGEALRRLRRRAEEYPDERAYHYLLADLLQGDARAQELRKYTHNGPPSYAAMSLERLLARENGDATGRNWDRHVDPRWLVFGREEGHLWEFFPALLMSDRALSNEPHARAEAAYAASAIGDHTRAVALAEHLMDGSAFQLPHLVSMLGPVVDRRSRGASPVDDDHVTWLPSHLGLFLSGESDDGSLLAFALDLHPFDADQAYIIGNRVRRGRGEVSAWLRAGALPHRYKTRLGRLAELEDVRLLAVAVGDREAAEDLGAMVEGQRRGFLRREALVPLAILEEMMLEGKADALPL
jgi:hypothetical protein